MNLSSIDTIYRLIVPTENRYRCSIHCDTGSTDKVYRLIVPIYNQFLTKRVKQTPIQCTVNLGSIDTVNRLIVLTENRF